MAKEPQSFITNVQGIPGHRPFTGIAYPHAGFEGTDGRVQVLTRRVLAEFLGAGILLMAIIGSGIMAARLSPDAALELLVNAGSIVCVLGVIIWMLGPISGAHFNPVVTGVAVARREMPTTEGALYVAAQIVGGLCGTALANVMFSTPAVQVSTHERGGSGLLLGELVATAGLLLVIGALTRTGHGHLGPAVVPAYIFAAIFFTSSTSFANPAVTIGRSISDTYAGIAPASVVPFIVMQLIGAALGAGLTELLFPRIGVAAEPLDLPDAVHHGATH